MRTRYRTCDNLILIAVLIVFNWTSIVWASTADQNKGSSLIAKFGADIWCPFTCESNIEDKPGIVTEVVYQALKNAKIEMRYEVVSWARAIKLAEDQKLNGLLGAYLSDLPSFLHPTHPIISSRDCFYTNSSDPWEYREKSSLENRKIGVIKDYGYGEFIDQEKKLKRNKNFFEVTGDKPLVQNLRKIEAGRIDTVLENELVINHVKSLGQGTKLKSAGCLEKKEIYVVFNPKDQNNKKYIQAIDLYIKSNPQKIATIIQKYKIK